MPRETYTPQYRIVEALDRSPKARVTRRPVHNFNLKSKPYEIVPFMIAPVLPGESLTNLLLQSTVKSQVINNSTIGWHKEYYFFYVPLLGLQAGWDTSGLLQTMMLDPTLNVAALRAANNSAVMFTFKGGIDYVVQCLSAVVLQFFRDEGEGASPYIENYSAARIDQDHWAKHIKLESETGDDEELPGVDPQEETDILAGFTTEYAQWEIMRDAQMTDLTYEDYLKSFGVNIPKSEETTAAQRFSPELIRNIRSWATPSNAVNPATGAIASAVNWKIAERADKVRFFKYPGFIFGVTLTRPKVYMSTQKGAAVGMLDNAYAWLPAALRAFPYAGIKETLDSATEGILQNQSEDYWVDLMDLYQHGDNFFNYTATAALTHAMALPTAALDSLYPTDAMVEALFVTPGAEYLYEDGAVFLNIATHLQTSLA